MEALLIKKRVKIIDWKNFVVVALDLKEKVFIIHIVLLRV